MENIKLYRWYDTHNLSELISLLREGSEGISNYTNSLDFSSDYGDIVWEYEIVKNIDVREENINERKVIVEDYDKIIDSQWIDGYRWLISDKWVHHYRIKNTCLKLLKIHYINKKLL